jgi:GTPase SAR1 family protein
MAQNKAYREAEERIEAAWRSGAKELLLMGMGLTEVPESLGRLTQLQKLFLGDNRLTSLPEWLGRLTQLQKLDLEGNRLTGLPEWLGQLTQLQQLQLNHNPLATLPESLGQLKQLRVLNLSGNQWTVLPECLSQLSQLQEMNLYFNQLTALPESFGNLKNLSNLSISGNRFNTFPIVICELFNLTELYAIANEIKTIPKEIGKLTKLRKIFFGGQQISRNARFGGKGGHGNEIESLPICLAQLHHLDELDLSDNPLSQELAAAYKEGLGAVKRYLNEMEKGARKRYEAKLLILGDGNEGKTCVSRALRRLPFREQKTTHGVDVEQWKFAHPDDPTDQTKDITLNIWDFEGQEISHQTHQFFLTSQSLYLLVFKCRDQFLMDRAEYWLDTIRARAPKAKVAIVISQCEERTPHVPLDRLQTQYGDLLAKEWFFAVGCKTNSNIEKLATFLQRAAADLEFMGEPWPMSYERAENEIKKTARKQTAHINREELYEIFSKSGVGQDNWDSAAAAMFRLGVVTQFPDCPDLRDFVVLRPQWLTKAISKVMEDAKLVEDKGEIALNRMEGIWNKKGYGGMFPTFHNCMKEFELCYDLEDQSQGCLMPLRFGYVQPPTPWSDSEPVKERRMEYKLAIRPPMGLISRFIVKTHHMIVKTPEYPKGVYWHNGVFLRTGDGAFRSEALCEFLPEDRKLRIVVRAAFPQNMSEQIHAYIMAVFSFFDGLKYERSYGCIKVDEKTRSEQPCTGLHTEKRIYTAISKERPTIDCEFEDHEVDPRRLVWGFGSFSEFVMARVVPADQLRRELDKEPAWAAPFLRGVGSLLDWVKANGGKMDQLLEAQSALFAEFRQEAELKLLEYLSCMSQMLDDRDHTAVPGLISITTTDRSPWNPVGYFRKTYVLTPFCECEGNIHVCEDAKVEFTKDRAWWAKTAPWIAKGTKLLAAGLQLAFAGMPLALGAEAADAMKDQVKFMQELTKHLELEAPKKNEGTEAEAVFVGDIGKDLRGGDREAALTRAALECLLEETAPNNYRARRWGSLRRVRMSDNSYRWLCEDCAKRIR